jgi:hypothetical protein
MKSLLDMYDAIQNDGHKRLKPMDKKGVSTEIPSKNLGLEHFVPPFLHMEMGLVNTTWEDIEQWVDDSVEIVLPYRKDACIAPIISKEKLQVAVQEKKIADQMINIKVCEKTAGVKMLRTELHKRTLTIKRRQDLHSRLTLLESFIEEQKLCLKSCKGKVKMTQEEHAKCKIN